MGLDEKDKNGMGFARLESVERMVKFKFSWLSLIDKATGLKFDKFLNELAKTLFASSWMFNSNK
tara:strand:+ start:809 stop:1000 length:192 start_codon:yes stop_codon:yes gene_type:complete